MLRRTPAGKPAMRGGRGRGTRDRLGAEGENPQRNSTNPRMKLVKNISRTLGAVGFPTWFFYASNPAINQKTVSGS